MSPREQELEAERFKRAIATATDNKWYYSLRARWGRLLIHPKIATLRSNHGKIFVAFHSRFCLNYDGGLKGVGGVQLETLCF